MQILVWIFEVDMHSLVFILDFHATILIGEIYSYSILAGKGGFFLYIVDLWFLSCMIINKVQYKDTCKNVN
jgi:hypothetical protein